MKPAVVNSRWELILPDHIAEWDAITGWEFPRFASMEEHLRQGMTLFDVGTEHGWISAVYASFVGADNMVLVEPTPEFWQNIRLTWLHNDLPMPRASLVALLGADGSPPELLTGAWPAPAYVEGECPAGGYRYLHEPGHVASTAVSTVDLVATDIRPDAITIDVEGAELEVLHGAERTLRNLRPLVWVSVHPDLMERDYDTTPGQLYDYMTGLGYEREHLGVDHETHELFRPTR